MMFLKQNECIPKFTGAKKLSEFTNIVSYRSTLNFFNKQLEISNQTLDRKNIKQPRLSILAEKKFLSNWEKLFKYFFSENDSV